MILGLIGVLPTVMWLIRNRLVASSATGREPEFHPVGPEQARQLLGTVSSWLMVPNTAPGLVQLAATIGVVLIVAYAGLLLLRPGDGTWTGMDAGVAVEVRDFLWLQLLSVVVYGALLVFSLSFVDANTPLDDRILAPVYVSMLFVVSLPAYSLWQRQRNRPVIRTVIAAALVVLVTLNIVESSGVIRVAYQQGIGWSSVRWRSSELMEVVRTLPEETILYSNAPDGLYIHTGRHVYALPKRPGPADAAGMSEYEEDLARIAALLEGGKGGVVHVAGLLGRSSSTATQDLQRWLSMDLVADTDDGQLYVAE